VHSRLDRLAAEVDAEQGSRTPATNRKTPFKLAASAISTES